MELTRAVDGFRLAYDRVGHGPAVVLLHGWPGDRTDYRELVTLLAPSAALVVPDLRGFGASARPAAAPTVEFGADGQARSIVALIEELGLQRPVLGGYDIGSRVAQAVARSRPDLVRALVISPPVPGAGDRVLAPRAHREFWYQAFHHLELCEQLVDGRPDAVRAYLRHFWSHWSGPGYRPAEDHLDQLVAGYAAPGAFTASIAWYRSGAGTVARSLGEHPPLPADRITTPTTVLWPEHDPLFPVDWSDRLDDYFADGRLQHVDGVGHFLPLEAPQRFAAALAAAADAPLPG